MVFRLFLCFLVTAEIVFCIRVDLCSRFALCMTISLLRAGLGVFFGLGGRYLSLSWCRGSGNSSHCLLSFLELIGRELILDGTGLRVGLDIRLVEGFEADTVDRRDAAECEQSEAYFYILLELQTKLKR